VGFASIPWMIPYSRAASLMTCQTHIFRIKHHLVLTGIVKCLFEVVKEIPTLF
jgi:hypothetical protein